MRYPHAVRPGKSDRLVLEEETTASLRLSRQNSAAFKGEERDPAREGIRCPRNGV
jgi:hypothetical protein